MLQPRRGCRHHIPCHRDGMDIHVRPYRSADEDKVLALSIRAWSSVFASMEQVLGREIFVRLHGEDWQTYQEKSEREVLADPAMQVVVADGERAWRVSSRPPCWTRIEA